MSHSGWMLTVVACALLLSSHALTANETGKEAGQEKAVKKAIVEEEDMPAGTELAREDILMARTKKDAPPRKVLIGTMLVTGWVKYPGLNARLEELGRFIDLAAAQAAVQYPGKGLDLIVLPETCVNDAQESDLAKKALPLKGKVLDHFSAKAREHNTYIVVGIKLRDDPEPGQFSNAAVLLGREGNVAGIYRKAHPVAYMGRDDLEGGVTPGKDFPVFDCDFGKLGIQICYDYAFDDGWDTLGRKGAEIVAWPSASPQLMRPAALAYRDHYYIVSSCGGNNATIFEPNGLIAAQVKGADQVLVHQIDLSYAILHWSPQLQEGRAFRNKYGRMVGHNYTHNECSGIFWSNDPNKSIGEMMSELGIAEYYPEVARNRKLQDAARGGPPE